MPPTDSQVPMLQLIDDQRQRLDGPYAQYLKRLEAQDLLAMHTRMVLTRRFDNEMTALQRQGQLALWASSLGQEGGQVGASYALQPADYAFGSYREHAVANARGVDFPDMIGLWRGADHASWDPDTYRCGMTTLVIAAQTLHAVGYAMGMARSGECGTGDESKDGAVLVFYGDGASSEGDANEAMVFATTQNAPVVFVCQNNQWAISEPVSRQSITPLFQRAAGFGLPSQRVDGNDVFASYAATAQALERARAGEGPSFIELFTYRMAPHTTSDDPTRYRESSEEDYWRQRDPISRFEKVLTADGLLTDEYRADLEDRAEDLATKVRQRCLSTEAAPLAAQFDHVYATPHPLVAEEKAWWQNYSSSFVPEEGERR